MRISVLAVVALTAVATAAAIGWRFNGDLAQAQARAVAGSAIAQTPCGPIEYRQAGTGVPLLVVHGSGGGQDQGMAFAGSLAQRGIRVIAISRFGYLRTPMPADATPPAQADANICLLDALGIQQAAVLGASAGAPSAMQTAIRHPDRVSALVLVVPIAYRPGALADSAPPPWAEKMLLRLLGSDFLFWTALHIARDTVIRHVLATPPTLVAAASPAERARVAAMLDDILPVSARAQGLRSDTALGRSLPPYALESIRAPTLIVSARDDGYGTFAGAQYTASRIAGAKFIGFESGGHLLVGRDDALHAAITQHVLASRP
jgi:2-hydroxy-6-oxonona-2,4-dienedioate hydrolase